MKVISIVYINNMYICNLNIIIYQQNETCFLCFAKQEGITAEV